VLADRDIRLPPGRHLILLVGWLIGFTLIGITAAAPCGGGLLALLIIPTLARALSMIAQRRSAGEPMTTSEKVRAFAASLGITLFVASLLAVATIIAVNAVCSGGTATRSVRGVGLIDVCAGLTVGAVVLCLLGWSIWRNRS
jgi:hypothetical protein